ncbi:CCA tRNA nucleotidyltransferase [Algisphaera agarilytica]|uniref:tRNA nucleotidyltransferase/poly(A) polymerase n=1 Tax=Algisphaera agarilytica TaxID=1385975 RepID=A0A7X0H450_9BACT|nr:CCA tRNA nucleotidyltransferase [Algisphaera agarilytica]MBB6428743.1 tRNA nucleotidyltransferase/poly(A) polymerase [Algisphaera agarilytica]
MSRDAATTIIQTLREHGHVAYLAGGCVRDRLLGVAPKDHDVATDAPPDVVQKLFRRSQPVGEAFGVILVYAPGINPNADAEPQRGEASGTDRPQRRFVPIEVATFRTEGVYSDGRRPDEVNFTTAEHDAQRRDFTINGLFEDPLHPDTPNPDADGHGVIDYVGGRADLESKTLRAIGDPDRRFGEDYLRMLRAVRFTTRLGFTLDPSTAQAIRNLSKFLSQISRERIGGELQLMLTTPHFAASADLLQQLRLDGPTLNEDHLDAEMSVLTRLSPDAGYAAKLTAWMIDRHGLAAATPARVRRWRKALCLSNDDTDTLNRILRQLHAAEDWATMSVAKRKRLLSMTDWDQTLLVWRAMKRADAIDADTPALIEDGIGLAPAPLVDGADLIAMQLKPGPLFKTLLDQVYDAQLEGRVTDRQAALAWVRQSASEG